VTLDDSKGFVWEAAVPEKILARQIFVQLAINNFIGKIDVQGYRNGQWTILAKNAAVFNTEGNLRGHIDIPKADYERLRLYLTGFDRNAKQMLSPIKTVGIVGERMGKDFAGQILPLPFQQSETQTEYVIDAALPGSGLWIRSLILSTEAQFQGSWQLGSETIINGQKKFVVRKKGRITHIDRQQQILTIDLDTQWPGNSLVLKLNTNHRYIGAITRLEVDVRLPRLVFAAEKKGRYTLLSGTGQKTQVLNRPGDALRQPDIELSPLPAAQFNPQWQPASLVKRYQLRGAPFDPTGYTWRSRVTIAQPGYYRLTLNLASVLKSEDPSIRIVKDDFQVPFIQGRIESQNIDLIADEIFDVKKNQGQWTLQLPGPSDQWQNLTLHAEGIFRRQIQIKRPKPGNMGWQPWRTATWENRDLKKTALRLNLYDFPADMDRILIIMDNEDNQQVKISKITARYATRSFYFLAHQAGEYLVCGGNTQASSPRYDLSLVKNELLAVLPEEAKMGDLESFQEPGWRNQLNAAFKDTGWGLYAVLGLVTLVLIGVIVRLFPKDKIEPSHDQ
jgi:hypothetical protein